MAQYIVTIDVVDADPLLPIDRFADLVKKAILPSLEALAKLQEKGKILTGGYPIGERHIVLIVEAESEEELQAMFEDLPISDIAKVNSTRMKSLQELREEDIGRPFPF